MAAFPDLDDAGERLAVTLYRILAEGQPVSVATLAQRCAMSESQVADTLASWPGVFQDKGGNVVGFWGLALPEMAHRYTVRSVVAIGELPTPRTTNRPEQFLP